MLTAKSIIFALLLFSCGSDEDAGFSFDPVSDNIVSPDYRPNLICFDCGENLNSFVVQWDDYTATESDFTSYEVLFGEESQSVILDKSSTFFMADNLSPSSIIDNVIYVLHLNDGSSIRDTITAFTRTLSPASWPEENAIKTSLTDSGESTNTISWIDSIDSDSETKIYRLVTLDASFVPEVNILEDLSGWTELEIETEGSTSITDAKGSSNDIHFYLLKTTLDEEIRYSTIKRDINLTSSFQHFPNFSASNNRQSKIVLAWEAYDQNDFYSYEIWQCADDSCDDSSADHVITITDKSISSFSYNTSQNRGKTMFFKLTIKNIFDYEKDYTASGVSL